MRPRGAAARHARLDELQGAPEQRHHRDQDYGAHPVTSILVNLTPGTANQCGPASSISFRSGPNCALPIPR